MLRADGPDRSVYSYTFEGPIEVGPAPRQEGRCQGRQDRDARMRRNGADRTDARLDDDHPPHCTFILLFAHWWGRGARAMMRLPEFVFFFFIN